jgi:hypothetical protein
VTRPTGASPADPGVGRPTGPTTGFTFRPLFEEPFRLGDRFPRNEAARAGAERTDLDAEALTLEFGGRADLLPGPRPDLLPDRRLDLVPDPRFDLLPEARPDLLPAERFDLLPDRREPRFDRFNGDRGPGRELRSDLRADDPALSHPERQGLRADEPALPGAFRFDLRADQEAPEFFPEPVPPVIDGEPGEIVGGTFTGGAVGTLYSWLLEDELGNWRLFDQSEYREDRFDVNRPLPRRSPLQVPAWKSSGQASVGPDWSPLREEQRWGVSGRAGYGPDWSVLRGTSK